MLLEEDPSNLIRCTLQNFNIAPDKLSVSRVSESISTLQQARELRLKAASNAVKKLARQSSMLDAQHAELAAAHAQMDHAAELARLDTHKFRVAKAASDLEMETESLQSQLDDLAARLQELELQGPDGGNACRVGGGEGAAGSTVEDEVLLRLKVYRSLGIDLERDEGEGEFNKAVVRSDRNGDVHVVNIDPKFSRLFYANYFWSIL